MLGSITHIRIVSHTLGSITHIGIVSHTMGEYHTYTTMKYLVVQSYNIPIFSMPSLLTCKNAYNVHARSNVIQYHTEYHSAPTNVFCVHYICSRYRSLLWDIAPIAMCATTIQCRTQKCGTTHSLVWEAPPLGLAQWVGNLSWFGKCWDNIEMKTLRRGKNYSAAASALVGFKLEEARW